MALGTPIQWAENIEANSDIKELHIVSVLQNLEKGKEKWLWKVPPDA